MLVDKSLPVTIEQVTKEVVQSVADDLEMILEDFMPDGVAFGEEAMSQQRQLEEYLAAGLHDNPEAAANWMRERVAILTQKLQEWGVPPELIPSIHPYNIVEVAALQYSAKMERMLRERVASPESETPISSEIDGDIDVGTATIP